MDMTRCREKRISIQGVTNHLRWLLEIVRKENAQNKIKIHDFSGIIKDEKFWFKTIKIYYFDMSSRGELKSRGPIKLRELDDIFEEVAHTPGCKKLTIDFKNGKIKGQLAENIYKNFDRKKYTIEFLFFQRTD